MTRPLVSIENRPSKATVIERIGLPARAAGPETEIRRGELSGTDPAIKRALGDPEHSAQVLSREQRFHEASRG